VLSVPDARVAEHRTADFAVVTPETPMHEVARQMVSRHVHRMFVVEDRRIAGVLTTRDVVRLVADVRSPIPLARMMTTSVVSIRADEPLSLAVDRLPALRPRLGVLRGLRLRGHGGHLVRRRHLPALVTPWLTGD